jgi:hypothetical protein
VTPAEVAAVEASLVSVRFLGCRTRVAPRLAAILARVEESLHAEWQRAQVALPGGAPVQTFAEWHGVRSCGGYRKGAGWHAKGLAVDIDYRRQGYVVTRTRTARGVVYGGEAAGAGFRGVREAFAAACDRACVALDGEPADLSARKAGESTGAVWDRWDRTSRAVAAYLAPYYQTEDDLDAGDADEREGVEIPPQVAADYQALRVPLVVGQPLPSPRLTRNPARGLIAWTRPVFVALGHGGLRLGLSDFGAREAGDAHHVDTASRIASGAV